MPVIRSSKSMFGLRSISEWSNWLASSRSPMRSGRQCGAIALHHAYRRLGSLQCREEIWARIATRDRNGGFAAASFRLAADAIGQGFEAIVFKIKQVDVLLQKVAQLPEVQFIACHRLRPGTSLGHFSLLASTDRDTISVFSDDKPNIMRHDRHAFLKLWRDNGPGDEFAARVAIAICPADARNSTATANGSMSIPAETACLRCGQIFSLRLLQRMFESDLTASGERSWDAVFCPYCDAGHR